MRQISVSFSINKVYMTSNFLFGIDCNLILYTEKAKGVLEKNPS